MERDEVSLSDYIRGIKKRGWAIVVTLLLVIAATALITFSLPKVYRATATLQNCCIPRKAEVEQFMEKDEVLDSLISRFGLEMELEEMKELIQVRNICGTDLFQLEVEYPRKGIPQEICENLVEQYFLLGKKSLEEQTKLVYEQRDENNQLLDESRKNLDRTREALSKIQNSESSSLYQIGIEAILLNSISSFEREIHQLIREGYVLEMRIQGIKNFEVVNKPRELPHPVKPRVRLYLAASVVVGLVLGLMVAFFKEFLVQRRKEGS